MSSQRVSFALALLLVALLGLAQGATYTTTYGYSSTQPSLTYDAVVMSGTYQLTAITFGTHSRIDLTALTWHEDSSGNVHLNLTEYGYDYKITNLYTEYPSGGSVNFAGNTYTLPTNTLKSTITIDGYNDGQINGSTIALEFSLTVTFSGTAPVLTSLGTADALYERYGVTLNNRAAVLDFAQAFTTNNNPGVVTFSADDSSAGTVTWTMTSGTLVSGQIVFDPSFVVRDSSDIPGLPTDETSSDSDDGSSSPVGAIVGAIGGVAAVLLFFLVALVALIVVAVVVVVVVVIVVVVIVIAVAVLVVGVLAATGKLGGGGVNPSGKMELWWVDEEDEDEEDDHESSDIWDDDEDDDDDDDYDNMDYSDIDEDVL